MKRILTFCVVLGFVFSGVRAQDASSLQNVVAIYPVQGERVLFSFASNPELSFTATELVITTAGTSVQYPINQLRSVKFEKAEIAEGIDEIEVPEHFLFRDGQIVTMSKRTGKAIQLRDLLDEVPVDSARFIFNTREATTQMDFDLDLAIQQDSQNPVYYVQYAHARICSILRNLESEGIAARSCTEDELCLLGAPEEVELIHLLSSFDSEIIAAARDYDPTKITKYVTNVATYFHKFYNACRV